MKEGFVSHSVTGMVEGLEPDPWRPRSASSGVGFQQVRNRQPLQIKTGQEACQLADESPGPLVDLHGNAKSQTSHSR